MTSKTLCANCGEPMQQVLGGSIRPHICLNAINYKRFAILCETPNAQYIRGLENDYCPICSTQLKTYFLTGGIRIKVCPKRYMGSTLDRMNRLDKWYIYCNDQTVFGMKKAFENRNTTLDFNNFRIETKSQIDDANLYINVNLALQLGLPETNLPEMFGAAITLGRSVGLSDLKAIESLVKGIGRKSRMVLDNLGIVVDSTIAYEWYRQMNKIDLQDSLTKTQKDNAWRQYAIHLVIEAAGELET